MKKYFSFVLILVLLSIAAVAQRSTPDRFIRIRNNSPIVKLERIQLYQDQLRYRLVQRNARRDGVVTPAERRKVCKARRKNRNDGIRFRNNHLHR